MTKITTFSSAKPDSASYRLAVGIVGGYNEAVMELVLQSINYHDCPVQEREKVSLSPHQREHILRGLLGRQGVGEAAIVQTCNRTEVYLYAKKDADWGQPVCELIGQLGPEAAQIWREHRRQSRGIDIVRHLFGVAAGLDSQMLGENQILSQLKSAYTESIERHGSKFIFHKLFHAAFRVGKAVRTQTDINCGAVSISLAAVELAREQKNIAASAVMIIGAGENAELAARYLVKGGIARLTVANRNKNNAEAVCKRLGTGRVIGLNEIPAALDEVDLVIASTGADRPVVTYEDIEGVLRKRTRPLLMIDIAVPRDIDERLGEFGCVTLVNIDDLDSRIAVNRQKRSSEIPKAEKIVDDFTVQFGNWLDSLSLVPVVSNLTQKATEVALAEARRYAKDFGNGNSEKLEQFAESLARKLLHGPISFLKDVKDEDPTTQQLRALDLVNKMFLLDEREQ